MSETRIFSDCYRKLWKYLFFFFINNILFNLPLGQFKTWWSFFHFSIILFLGGFTRRLKKQHFWEDNTKKLYILTPKITELHVGIWALPRVLNIFPENTSQFMFLSHIIGAVISKYQSYKNMWDSDRRSKVNEPAYHQYFFYQIFFNFDWIIRRIIQSQELFDSG